MHDLLIVPRTRLPQMAGFSQVFELKDLRNGPRIRESCLKARPQETASCLARSVWLVDVTDVTIFRP